MSQSLSLYRLQQIDSQIDRLLLRLQELQKALDDDSEQCRLKGHLETANARLLSAESTLKQAERDVQNQFIKIEQIQSSLYGEKFHSPKELQELQSDVLALKRYLVNLEDRQIDAMQEFETAEAEQRAASVELNKAIDNKTALNKGYLQEQKTIQNEQERLMIERNAVAGAIPATEFTLYDQLRRQRRGVAVALIVENSCGACGSTLSLAQVQSSRSSERMLHCPSCGRILYGS
jgi:uncharacterized protein